MAMLLFQRSHSDYQVIAFIFLAVFSVLNSYWSLEQRMLKIITVSPNLGVSSLECD